MHTGTVACKLSNSLCSIADTRFASTPAASAAAVCSSQSRNSERSIAGAVNASRNLFSNNVHSSAWCAPINARCARIALASSRRRSEISRSQAAVSSNETVTARTDSKSTDSSATSAHTRCNSSTMLKRTSSSHPRCRLIAPSSSFIDSCSAEASLTFSFSLEHCSRIQLFQCDSQTCHNFRHNTHDWRFRTVKARALCARDMRVELAQDAKRKRLVYTARLLRAVSVIRARNRITCMRWDHLFHDWSRARRDFAAIKRMPRRGAAALNHQLKAEICKLHAFPQQCDARANLCAECIRAT
mmetsp:Transcript_7845/g.12752  ORF Transcript_7845/g.12752 Transcript_7845/m.12752 type:complete len:300 (-) Transcript_7845:1355-2254(-)